MCFLKQNKKQPTTKKNPQTPNTQQENLNLNEQGKGKREKNGKLKRLDLTETFRKEITRAGNGTSHNNYPYFLQLR